MARLRSVTACTVSLLVLGLSLRGLEAQTSPGVGSRVTGLVYDSLAAAPLAGAIVQLVDAGDRSRGFTSASDSTGAFALESVPAGRYVIGFLHPRLDALRLATPGRELRLPARDSRVELFIPSGRALATAVCGDAATEEMPGLLLGHLRSARTANSAPRGRVAVQWTELVLGAGLHSGRPAVVAETDEQGAFAVCGVPLETPLFVQGGSEEVSSGQLVLELPPGGVLVRDLLVDTVRRTEVAVPAADDSASGLAGGAFESEQVLRGDAVLRGVVRRPDNQPIAGARVRIRETGRVVTTDSTGAFVVSEAPAGTHMVETFAIGYAPLREHVDLMGGSATDVAFSMTTAETALDTVRVLGRRREPSWKRGFEDRRKQGMGRFVDEAAIARRDPIRVSDLLASLPGVTVRMMEFSSRAQLLLRNGRGGLCVPDVFIDRMPIDVTDLGVDAYVMAQQLVGVELYRSRVLRPAEFITQRGCGAIVLWTGVRQAPPTRP